MSFHPRNQVFRGQIESERDSRPQRMEFPSSSWEAHETISSQFSPSQQSSIIKQKCSTIPTKYDIMQRSAEISVNSYIEYENQILNGTIETDQNQKQPKSLEISTEEKETEKKINEKENEDNTEKEIDQEKSEDNKQRKNKEEEIFEDNLSDENEEDIDEIDCIYSGICDYMEKYSNLMKNTVSALNQLSLQQINQNESEAIQHKLISQDFESIHISQRNEYIANLNNDTTSVDS